MNAKRTQGTSWTILWFARFIYQYTQYTASINGTLLFAKVVSLLTSHWERVERVNLCYTQYYIYSSFYLVPYIH